MTKRYQFTGVLQATTGLHIGSGRGNFATDATFVRTGLGEPYIPGSSLKGVLRSAVERMAASLGGVGLRSCLLDAGSGLGDANCPTVHQEWKDDFNRARERGLNDDEIDEWLYQGGKSQRFPQVTLCDTCRLFGSPYVASKVAVADLPLRGAIQTEIRHGVGIDRDSGTARAQIKFDYEAVPMQSAFSFQLSAEDVDGRALGLLCVGLRELENGAIGLGGNRSRGLGGCTLTLTGLQEEDLSDPAAWLARLLRTPAGAQRTTPTEITAWLDGRIAALFGELGVA